MSRVEVIESPCAAQRLQAAGAFLDALGPSDEALVVGAWRGAVDDFIRGRAQAARAIFGLHRLTLTQLAARLAAPALAARGLASCTRLAAEAVAARATFAALAGGAVPYFAPVARCPGFARSLTSTLAELRAAAIDPAQLAREPAPAGELAALLAGYAAQLEAGGLADRALLLEAAIDAARSTVDPLLRLPLLLLDVAVDSQQERELLAALCAAAPTVLATVPTGDARTRAALTACGATISTRPPEARSSLSRLQRYLFNETEEPPASEPDESVRFLSAPGEGREAVEIARWILREARAGTRLDAITVFLRAPETYTPLLETAFRRADIPAYFARGTRRPNPSGRAFLALLACACEGLSATRFAEYLSFGHVPTTAAPPASWVGPRDDLLGAATAASERADEPAPGDADSPRPDDAPRPTLPAPWKWEELLVDAAVIGGGAERWRRRLDGLRNELDVQRQELASEEPESPRVAALARTRDELEHLAAFALPVVEQLAAFPAEAAWGEWLARLRELAAATLRWPQGVQQVLAELEATGSVGPVGLDEVREVLTERLTALTDEPPKYRYGRVLVTTLDDARGRVCDVAFVPGLAERILPQRPREDPLLLDAKRAPLSAALSSQDERVDRERLLLRLAVGTARQRLYISYPRVDVAQGRPRVISFYGLDAARATRGGIPGLDVFEREAAALGNARLAWPAPPDPGDAIDAAEHDLAMLALLIRAPAGSNVRGAAQYLIELNPHLARSLRTRFWRWEEPRWSARDGLVRPGAATLAALEKFRLTERAYSPSALERFAVCPYRFFLSAIHGLRPRQSAAPLEQLDPLTRGRLFHRVQAETLRDLADTDLLPLTADRLSIAERVLDATLTRIAEEFHDMLAPPIARVWRDEMALLGADLLQWLRRLVDSAPSWRPELFEFGFGLPPGSGLDPRSRREDATVLGGVRLRGCVDLVERAAAAEALRVTDHKTGANRSHRTLIVGGGEVLQPVLYGMAVEVVLQTRVASARLFYCTERAGFAEHEVPLDERARAAGRQVLDIIDRSIGRGFLPAAPRPKDNTRPEACARCDFHLVCGPHEGERLGRKDAKPLADLVALRQQP